MTLYNDDVASTLMQRCVHAYDARRGLLRMAYNNAHINNDQFTLDKHNICIHVTSRLAHVSWL